MVRPIEIPAATVTNEDDVQNIDIDLNDLVSRFVSPIEAYRSLSVPNLHAPTETITQQLNSAQINSNEPAESRAHTFYRMIGLPVISQSGFFYNPGFNPNLSTQDQMTQDSVARDIATATTNMQQQREQSVADRQTIFKKAGVAATVYAIALGVFGGERKLNVLSDSGNYKTEDTQKIQADQPRISLLNKYSNLDGTPINDSDMSFKGAVHILRPFSVDPVIERTVRTVNGASGMICQPFLKERKDTRIEPNRYLKRPGIEFILRMRLKQKVMSESTAANIATTLQGAGILSDAQTVGDLKQIAQALMDRDNITDQDLQTILSTSQSIELTTISTYVKTLKALVDMLVSSFAVIAFVTSKITWDPLPSDRGPEFGVQNGSNLRYAVPSLIERRLHTLQVKKQIATSLQTLSLDSSITPDQFALSEFQGVEKTYEDEIGKTEEEIKSLEDQGSNALRQIEILLGEISGLGLMDILAVYTALWAIDIKALIGLLDNSAFQRLYDNNKDLRSMDVEARRTGSFMTVDAANKALEDTVSNILKFVDGQISSQVNSQKRKNTGSPAGS